MYFLDILFNGSGGPLYSSFDNKRGFRIIDSNNNGGVKFYVNGAGNVGIGTTTPGDQLEVAKIDGEASISIRSDSTTTSYRSAVLYFGCGYSSTARRKQVGIFTTPDTTTGDAHLDFCINSSNTWGNDSSGPHVTISDSKMRIHSNGTFALGYRAYSSNNIRFAVGSDTDSFNNNNPAAENDNDNIFEIDNSGNVKIGGGFKKSEKYALDEGRLEIIQKSSYPSVGYGDPYPGLSVRDPAGHTNSLLKLKIWTNTDIGSGANNKSSIDFIHEMRTTTSVGGGPYTEEDGNAATSKIVSMQGNSSDPYPYGSKGSSSLGFYTTQENGDCTEKLRIDSEGCVSICGNHHPLTAPFLDGVILDVSGDVRSRNGDIALGMMGTEAITSEGGYLSIRLLNDNHHTRIEALGDGFLEFERILNRIVIVPMESTYTDQSTIERARMNWVRLQVYLIWESNVVE